jgi:hypothetical protein
LIQPGLLKIALPAYPSTAGDPHTLCSKTIWSAWSAVDKLDSLLLFANLAASAGRFASGAECAHAWQAKHNCPLHLAVTHTGTSTLLLQMVYERDSMPLNVLARHKVVALTRTTVLAGEVGVAFSFVHQY